MIGVEYTWWDPVAWALSTRSMDNYTEPSANKACRNTGDVSGIVNEPRVTPVEVVCGGRSFVPIDEAAWPEPRSRRAPRARRMGGGHHLVLQSGCNEHHTGLDPFNGSTSCQSQSHHSPTCGHLLEHSTGLKAHCCASSLSRVDQCLIEALPRQCPTAWQCQVERFPTPAKSRLIKGHRTLITDQVREPCDSQRCQCIGVEAATTYLPAGEGAFLNEQNPQASTGAIKSC